MRSLQAHQLATFLAEQPPGGVILLDVREAWEVEHAPLRLDGAQTLHWPMMSIPQRLNELPETPSIVCICHHGVRSAQVVAFLMRQGWSDVYNLAGGVDAWSRTVDPSVPLY